MLINFLPKNTFEYTGETLSYAARVDKEALAFGEVPSNQQPLSQVVRLTNRGENAITPVVTLEGPGFTFAYEATELAKCSSEPLPRASLLFATDDKVRRATI